MSRHRKRKRGLLLRLRSLRYRQTPNNHIRVKVHASGVSTLAFTLGCSFYYGEISENKFRAYASVPICTKYIFIYP